MKTLDLLAKYAEYLNNMGKSVKENPKLFWLFVRAKSEKPGIPDFVNFSNTFASTLVDKANLFNLYFQSVFAKTDDYCSDNYVNLQSLQN